MKNKRAVIGDFIVTFVSIVIIVALLIGFAFSASLIKASSRENVGTVVFNEDSLGLSDGVGYMENYIKLIDAKSRVDDGVSLDEALAGVGYYEE